MGTDKFLQPTDAIIVTHNHLSNTLISPDMIAPYVARIEAGENRDKVLTELAQEIVELEDGLREDGLLPPLEIPDHVLRTNASEEGPLHSAADANENAFYVAIAAAFSVAQRELKRLIPGKPARLEIEPALAALKRALGQTLPGLLLKTLVAGGEVATGELKTAGFRAAKRGDTPKTQIKFEFDRENEDAIAWADRHAAELIDGITETSRETINNAIADLLESGDWKDAIDEITAAVGDPERARLIARNETMTAVSEGQRQAWDQAVEEGLLDEDSIRTWIAVGDEKVCPICEGLDGQTAKLGEPYESDGDEYDGPPAHVSCRCTEGISG